MSDFVMSVRATKKDVFTADVGSTKFLEVPPNKLPSPVHAIPGSTWYKKVCAAGTWKNVKKEDRGDILFVVHGYNMSVAEVIQRHRQLRKDLKAQGFNGVVVSFDWPSDDKTLAYLPDRHRAKHSAFRLVSDGIMFLSKQQTPSCTINIHLLGHSTGAYIIREAFDDADDTELPNACWSVSQLIFAAGDVSSCSMSTDDPVAESIYRHCVRMTNYYSRHDEALDLSNVKRLGTAPRAGRVGLPSDVPSKAVNVDCTPYYEQLTAKDSTILVNDQPDGFFGMQSHSWYFGNLIFTQDVFSAIIGQERTVIKTRQVNPDGTIQLKRISDPARHL